MSYAGLSGLGGTEARDVCLIWGVVETQLVCEAQRLDEILQKRILSPKMPQCAGSEEELGKRWEGEAGKEKPGRRLENQEHVCPGSQVKNAFLDKGTTNGSKCR